MSFDDELIRRYDNAKRTSVTFQNSTRKFFRDIEAKARQEMRDIHAEALEAWRGKFSCRSDVLNILEKFKEHPEQYFGKVFRVLETNLSNQTYSFPFSPPLTSRLSQKVMRDVLIEVLQDNIRDGLLTRTEEGFLYKENEFETARKKREAEAAKEAAHQKMLAEMEEAFAGRDDVDVAIRYIKKGSVWCCGCSRSHLCAYGSPCETVVNFDPPLKDDTEQHVMITVLNQLAKLSILSGSIPTIKPWVDLQEGESYGAVVTYVYNTFYEIQLLCEEVPAKIYFSNNGKRKDTAESVTLNEYITVIFKGYNYLGEPQFKRWVRCTTGWVEYPKE